MKTIELVYPVWVGWGGGQVELFNDLVFTVVRGTVSVVRSGEVISVLRELEDSEDVAILIGLKIAKYNFD